MNIDLVIGSTFRENQLSLILSNVPLLKVRISFEFINRHLDDLLCLAKCCDDLANSPRKGSCELMGEDKGRKGFPGIRYTNGSANA